MREFLIIVKKSTKNVRTLFSAVLVGVFLLVVGIVVGRYLIPWRPSPEIQVVYVDAGVDYIEKPETIAEWARTFNDEKIAEHGWKVWAAITKDSGQGYPAKCGEETIGEVRLPIWDTWVSEVQLFPLEPGDVVFRPYHPITQSGMSDVLSFNKYNMAFELYVKANKLNSAETLLKANNGLPETPISKRTIDEVLKMKAPVNGIMLKPAYWAVKKGEASLLPYWKGPGLEINGTVNPRKPTERTWTQVVLVNDTGRPASELPREFEIVVYPDEGPRTIKVKPDKVTTVEDFYAVPLTNEDIEYIKSGNIFQFGGVEVRDLECGDWALLVAMHVTTVEWKNWTWQTFWWTPNRETSPQPGVNPPWTNYNMASAYYMVGPDDKPHIAFNPHLEPPIVGANYMNQFDRGAESNCITCHRVAAFPTVNADPNPANFLLGSYRAKGKVTEGDAYFRNRLQTIFMWTPVLRTQMSKEYKDNYKKYLRDR